MDSLFIIAFHLYWALCVYVLLVGWIRNGAQRTVRWFWFLALVAIQSATIWNRDLDWSLVAIIGITAYAVFVPWQPTGESRQIGLIWFVTLPVVVFVAFHYVGTASWDVLYWLGIGDEYDVTQPRRIGIAVAVLAAVIVFVRLATGRAGLRYRRVTLAGSIALLCLYGGDGIIRFAMQIDGWSARGAAENYFARYSVEGHPYIDKSASPRIVEEELSLENPGWAKGGWFVLYYGPARIRYVHVHRHGPWWWSAAGNGDLHPGVIDFDLIEKNWDADPEGQVKLEAIIRDYPNSEASTRAEQIVRELQSRPKRNQGD